MSFLKHRAPLVLAAVFAIACGDSPSDPGGGAMLLNGLDPGSDEAELIRVVAPSTARFHSIVQARRHGYVDTHECVEHEELGGMGVHWVNESLIDDVFDPRRPEALLYEIHSNGRPRLVAVEYIVLDEGQQQPAFAGQLFDVGGAPLEAPHWTLHVWLWRENSAGMFAPFNPGISCP